MDRLGHRRSNQRQRCEHQLKRLPLIAVEGGMNFTPGTMLAKVASAITLLVFASVNAALLQLKWSGEARHHELFTVPYIIPLSGFIICSAMLVFAIWDFF